MRFEESVTNRSKNKNNVKIFFRLLAIIITWTIFVVLMIMLVFLLFYYINIKAKEFKGDTTPPNFGIYVILTGSMRPSIQPGDVVVTRKVDPNTLKKGDIITFMNPSNQTSDVSITHRIINVTKKDEAVVFKTKGDANNTIDDVSVEGVSVRGKVFMKIPYVGFIQHFIASKGGWLIVIMIPSFAIIAYDIVKLIKLLTRKSAIRKSIKEDYDMYND